MSSAILQGGRKGTRGWRSVQASAAPGRWRSTSGEGSWAIPLKLWEHFQTRKSLFDFDCSGNSRVSRSFSNLRSLTLPTAEAGVHQDIIRSMTTLSFRWGKQITIWIFFIVNFKISSLSFIFNLLATRRDVLLFADLVAPLQNIQTLTSYIWIR